MAAPHYLTTTGKPVTVDVKPLFVGFTNGPTYAVADAKNGTVALSGTTATFTPTGCGRASFNVTVTDKDGSKMTRTIGAFIDSGSACP